MKSYALPLLFVLRAACCSEPSALTPDAYAATVQPVFAKYCHQCHGLEKTKGGVNLVKCESAAALSADPKMWADISRVLKEREMPPSEKTQPADTERDALVKWIDATLASAAPPESARDPGRVTARRLTRLEYDNTIRDLLGVDTHPAQKFPADGSGGGGFDNNADTLFVTPLLLEQYLQAARDVLARATDERLGITPDKRSYPRAILTRFASRAFRRPATTEEVARLTQHFQAAEDKGANFAAAIRNSFAAVLVSPQFLFRTENDPVEGAHALNDYELASRLSYFLWASLPDDELFDLAAANSLHNPHVLSRQVARLLADPKSAAFTENFSAQWLGIQSFKTSAQPDPQKFPKFTPSLRDAMYRETVVYFDTVIRGDRSLFELLDSDYAMLNEELAGHYGIADVKGPQLRKVNLKDRTRGGLLCMGSVLTASSYPLRTSPVLRGKWVLSEILGTPPPPPPSMVKTLPQNDKVKGGLTFRQSLEAHRKNAECAGCHARMDPIGFGLESFDAVGRWRTEISGQKVDASGVFTTGEKFDGPAELKTALLKRKGEFLRNLAERMLSYALGRGIEKYDAWSVNEICTKLEQRQYRGAALVELIATSYPFRYRRK